MSAEKKNLFTLEKWEKAHKGWKMNLLEQCIGKEKFSSVSVIRTIPSEKNGFGSTVISGKSCKDSLLDWFNRYVNAITAKAGAGWNLGIQYKQGVFVDGRLRSLLEKNFIPLLLKLAIWDSLSRKNPRTIVLRPFAQENFEQPTSVRQEKSNQADHEVEAFDEVDSPTGSSVNDEWRWSLSPGSSIEDDCDDAFDCSENQFCKVVGCVDCLHEDNIESQSGLKPSEMVAFEQGIDASYHMDKCFSSAFQVHDVFANVRNERLSKTTQDLLLVRCKLFQEIAKNPESHKGGSLLGLRKYPFEETDQADGQKPSKISTLYMNHISIHDALV